MPGEFFRTGMGKRYYEVTLPELVRQLGRVADALEAVLAKWAQTEIQKDRR